MTVIDEIKIFDDKIKSNQAQYVLEREAAKISALSSKDLLEKYEYLKSMKIQDTDLAHLKKLSLSILPWVCHLVKHLKKITLKVMLRA